MPLYQERFLLIFLWGEPYSPTHQLVGFVILLLGAIKPSPGETTRDQHFQAR